MPKREKESYCMIDRWREERRPCELMYEFMGDIDIHSMSVYVCMRERINVRVEGRHRYT